MPTGFTADMHDGKPVTFEQFVWKCVRGMGVAARLRDTALDTMPPRVEPETEYSTEQLVRARARLAELEAMTPEQAAPLCDAEHAELMAQWRDRQGENSALRKRYEEMLARVQAWEPPTTEHEGLKRFMVGQLEESIRWDCGCEDRPPPEKTTPEHWLALRILGEHESIAYHRKRIAEEEKRTDEHNRWLATLAASVRHPGDAG